MLILQVSTLEQRKNCGIPTAKNCIGWIRTTDGCIWTSGKAFSIHWEHLDVPMIRGLLVAFNGRVTAGAGSKPYLSVTLHPDEKPLELLQSILKAMAEILKPAE